MTKSLTIQQILNKSEKEYGQEYFDRYVKWCEGLAHEDMILLQQLLANTAISVYFLQRFEDIEHQALQILKPQYNLITAVAASRIYETMMLDLFATYPKPLLEAAKKLRIDNDPTAN